MKPVSYDQIEPNIAEVDVQGDSVVVTWKCPVTGATVGQSGAAMEFNATEQIVKRGVARSLQMSFLDNVMSKVGLLFGSNSIGYQVAKAVSAPLASNAANQFSKVRYTDAMRRKATVAAFNAVSKKFAWDEDRGQYVAKKKDAEEMSS
jgi:hypothetical protein